MKKLVVLLVVALLSTVSYGQVKQVKLTDEEVNCLALVMGSPYKGSFNSEDANVLKLRNALSFLLEYRYDGKIIGERIIPLTILVGEYGYNFGSVSNTTGVCFKVSDLPNEIVFSLLKENWNHIKINEKEEFICSGNGGGYDGVKIFETKDFKTFKINSLADGKITLHLYRLEKSM